MVDVNHCFPRQNHPKRNHTHTSCPPRTPQNLDEEGWQHYSDKYVQPVAQRLADSGEFVEGGGLEVLRQIAATGRIVPKLCPHELHDMYFTWTSDQGEMVRLLA